MRIGRKIVLRVTRRLLVRYRRGYKWAKYDGKYLFIRLYGRKKTVVLSRKGVRVYINKRLKRLTYKISRRRRRRRQRRARRRYRRKIRRRRRRARRRRRKRRKRRRRMHRYVMRFSWRGRRYRVYRRRKRLVIYPRRGFRQIR